MENNSFFKKIFLKPAHWPTVLLILGYPVYWLELYVFKIGGGRTTLLASILFLIFCICAIIVHRRSYISTFQNLKSKFLQQEKTIQLYFLGGGILVFSVLLCTFYASLLPPHLIQESDALNYHITLPRQHLILGSFKHIPWAADDLFLLPIDFALAPFWLVTTLPNKFPQYLFFLGLVFVAIVLLKHFSEATLPRQILLVFAIFGSHHIGIQMGTAMLDLVISYLLLAALDSFLSGRIFLSIIEFTFFFWSKSFFPPFVVGIVIVLLLLTRIFKKLGISHFTWGFGEMIKSDVQQRYLKQLKKMILVFILLSTVTAGPFVIKSTHYAGTPLYPFAPGMVLLNKHIDKASTAWQSLTNASQKWVTEIKDSYGYGRSPLIFLKHFWLIAVPDEGVNNKYDYPLGLVYLLLVGPFVGLFINALKTKRLPIIPIFIVIYWLFWWMGSQQSRLLYIPVLLMLIVTFSELKVHSKALMTAFMIALIFNALSIFRAHRHDFGQSHIEVLREKDVGLLEMNKEYLRRKGRGMIDLDYHDAAFAQFPVRVVKERLPHTLAF
jgi:hypothetical protein